MNKILLTGFEAFGTTPINPAERIAMLLDREIIKGNQIISKVVPNTFFKSIEVVQENIIKYKPDVVVMLGEYGGRSMITVERIAHNFNDSARYQLADNDGKVLQGMQTVKDGPTAYYTTLPIRAMVKAMRSAGIPADISDTPGTNVCNHLMFGILHFIAIQKLDIRAGWIHLPHLPVTAAMKENLGAPSMSEDTSKKGVKTAIKAILQNIQDIDESIHSRWQI